jgi:hypothetical protein
VRSDASNARIRLIDGLNRFPVSETIFDGKLERGKFLLLCAVWNSKSTGSGVTDSRRRNHVG